jgi:hypothetical protein
VSGVRFAWGRTRTTSWGSFSRLSNHSAALRRVLIHDQADRDAVASQLLRYRDGLDDDWADIRHADDASGDAAGCGAEPTLSAVAPRRSTQTP